MYVNINIYFKDSKCEFRLSLKKNIDFNERKEMNYNRTDLFKTHTIKMRINVIIHNNIYKSKIYQKKYSKSRKKIN